MRGYLRTLADLGVIEAQRRESFPGSLDYQMLRPGKELLAVAEVTGAWLGRAPEGSLELGSTAAKSVLKALVDGWSTNMIRALAARPLSLTELNGVITGISYPSLERRLSALRLVGLVEETTSTGRRTPYMASEWMRRAVAPLAAATRWERAHVPKACMPIKRMDADALFLLAVPLVKLDPTLSGSCRLAVEVQTGEGTKLAGVVVAVEEGRVASCATQPRGPVDAWVSSPMAGWLRAIVEGDLAGLEIGGDCALARDLIEAQHAILFGSGLRG